MEDPNDGSTAGSSALDVLVGKLLEQGRMNVETWLHLMRRVGRKRNTFYLLDALDAFHTFSSARTAAAAEELGVEQLRGALGVAAAAMHGSDPDHAVERLVAEVEEVLSGVGGAGSADVYEQAYEGMCGGGAVLGVIREHEGVVRHIYSTYCAEDRFLAADEITWEEVCKTNMTMPFKDLASAARAHALVPDLLGVNEMELLFAEVTGVAREAVKDEGGANVSASFPEFLDLLWRFASLIPFADDVGAEFGGSGSGSPDQLRRRTNTSSVMDRLTSSGNQSNHSTSDAAGALDRWRMESLLDRMGLVVEGGRGGASSAVPIRPPVLGGGPAAGSGGGAMSATSSTAAMPLSERQAAELATAAAMRLERFLGELDVEVDSVTPSMLRLPPPPPEGPARPTSPPGSPGSPSSPGMAGSPSRSLRRRQMHLATSSNGAMAASHMSPFPATTSAVLRADAQDDAGLPPGASLSSVALLGGGMQQGGVSGTGTPLPWLGNDRLGVSTGLTVLPCLIREVLLAPEAPSGAANLLESALTYHNSAQYTLALQSYTAARRVWAEASTPPVVAAADGDAGGDAGGVAGGEGAPVAARPPQPTNIAIPPAAQVYFLNAIGSVHESAGDDEMALACYIDAKRCAAVALPHDHPDLAIPYCGIGSVCYAVGRFKLALRCFSVAMEVRERSLGKDHPDTLAVYNNVGAALLCCMTSHAGRGVSQQSRDGSLEEARFRLQNSFEGLLRELGERHPRTMTARRNCDKAKARSYALFPAGASPLGLEIREDKEYWKSGHPPAHAPPKKGGKKKKGKGKKKKK